MYSVSLTIKMKIETGHPYTNNSLILAKLTGRNISGIGFKCNFKGDYDLELLFICYYISHMIDFFKPMIFVIIGNKINFTSNISICFGKFEKYCQTEKSILVRKIIPLNITMQISNAEPFLFVYNESHIYVAN